MRMRRRPPGAYVCFRLALRLGKRLNGIIHIVTYMCTWIKDLYAFKYTDYIQFLSICCENMTKVLARNKNAIIDNN
jgi:hypothetical protein